MQAASKLSIINIKLEFVGDIIMWFWWFMLICDLLIPCLMIFAGRMMWKHTPKIINGDVGYRTSRSMKNIDTWRFANEHCGKLWCKIGKIMLFPSFILHLPFYGRSIETIGIFGAILSTIQVIISWSRLYPPLPPPSPRSLGLRWFTRKYPLLLPYHPQLICT